LFDVGHRQSALGLLVELQAESAALRALGPLAASVLLI
jgi:hypothetical protein